MNSVRIRRKFYNSSSIRRHEHDRISTALAGGHDDDTSCCSLSVDSRTPNFQVREGGDPKLKSLYMYYGNDLQYEVKKVSDIRANDYVFAHRTNSSQDQVDMIAVYEACSKALDDGLFVFCAGEFDCGNKYLEAENLYGPDKPWIKPDRLFPYYFRSSSPIRGRVTWDEMNTGDFGMRHVFVVNTDSDEDLAAKIPDGTIIYIGGDHSRDQLGFVSQYQHESVDWDLPLKMHTSKKSVLSWICRHNSSQKGNSDRWGFQVRPSSCFHNCCLACCRTRLNTAPCFSHEVHNMCWPTTAEPRNGRSVSQVPFSEVVPSFCEVEAGFSKDGSYFTVFPVDNKVADERDMKGVYLDADELGGESLQAMFKLVSGILQLQIDESRFMSLIMTLLRLSELMNPSVGFSTTMVCTEESGLSKRKLAVFAKIYFAPFDESTAYISSLSRGVFRNFIFYVTRKCPGTMDSGDSAPGGDQILTLVYDDDKGSFLRFLTYHTVFMTDGTFYVGFTEKCSEFWNPDFGVLLGQARL